MCIDNTESAVSQLFVVVACSRNSAAAVAAACDYRVFIFLLFALLLEKEVDPMLFFIHSRVFYTLMWDGLLGILCTTFIFLNLPKNDSM